MECENVIDWALWYGRASVSGERHIALDEIAGIRVSTIFLGIDHGFSFFNEEAKPVLFETMVFAGDWSEEEMRRYCTYEEAEAGHKEIVANIKRHPWSRIVLPRMKFFFRRSRYVLFKFGNKILAWMWPAILKVQSVLRYVIDKTRRNP